MKTKQMKMVATGPNGIKLSAIITVESDASSEVIGDIQSDFLWGLFEFDFEDIIGSECDLADNEAVNYYSDVKVIA